MKTKLTHVRANVKDLEKAKEWYMNNLGFHVTASWPPEKPNYIHFESERGATFALMESEQYPSYGRFNFDVSNAELLWEQLKGKVEIVEELSSTPYGTKKFTIKDLDGNELGFVQEGE